MQFGDQSRLATCHPAGPPLPCTSDSREKQEDRKTIEELLPETATNRLSAFGQVQLQANGFSEDKIQG